jgi:hypothetical protein
VGSIRAIFEALALDIETEVSRPENADGSGGTAFAVEVAFGQQEKSPLPGAAGRVVLTVGDTGEIGGPKVMNGRIRTLCTWLPVLEARLWVPVGQAGGRVALDRYDAIEALVRCVVRAIYAGNHGASMPDRPPVDSAEVLTGPAVLRHGEAAIIRFTVGIPITEGRTLERFPAGTRAPLTLTANPQQGG